MNTLDESAETLLSLKTDEYLSVNEIKTEIDEDSMDIDDEPISNNSFIDDIDESEQMPELGPAALGLQRVGTKPPPKKKNPPQPVQALNRRGMPARIRKKNKLFFDDALVNHPHHRIKKENGRIETKQSPRKVSRQSPVKKSLKKLAPSSSSTLPPTRLSPKIPTPPLRSLTPPPRIPTPPRPFSPPQPSSRSRILKRKKESEKQSAPSGSPDRKIGQKIGMRLRNLLKLPKAHKWVCYEWFYSNIDKPLFEGDNDFMICLKESFPQLKSRKLTRVEWCKIRRMMGKPRRCSQSFFEEERRELERKRQKIRMLQQRKTADANNFKDLPPEIPLQSVIGTKVTARLRKPQDGLFTGCIDAVDTSNNTYRITFERAGLGTHSVPDYEVLSNEPPDTVSVASFAHKFRPRQIQYVPSPPYTFKLRPPNVSDPLISNNAIPFSKKTHAGGNINGYPLKLLELMVKVNKILVSKKIKIDNIKEMNAEAEKKKSFGEFLPLGFEQKYAAIVVELEKMNTALQEFLNEIQEFCLEIAPEPSVAAMLVPSHLREICRQDAADMVIKNNIINDKAPTQMNQLVTDLTALMLQVKCLSYSDRNAYELKVLQGTVEQLRSGLTPKNQQVFQNCVEIHIQHIQLGLGEVGALKPFMKSKA